MPTTRALRLDDAAALADLLRTNREFLAPFEPERPEEWFTLAGQRASVAAALAQELAGSVVARVVVDEGGQVAGWIIASGIVRGALRSCALGYWVDEARNGRGLATAAVGEMVDHAFGPLCLHRVQAETLVHNVASQRVLERNGFTRYGLAPGYLQIAGRWQDHAMFQVLASDERPGR
ncbi:GNAT family N-acetyltransferase [Oerskovia sp. NPDC060287]|uniref:GNAT family N-acetyltransferase n=1 Tax=Oerskovia sp. NPDC060287 TaxID=3347095 RepID=UPI00364FB7B2